MDIAWTGVGSSLSSQLHVHDIHIIAFLFFEEQIALSVCDDYFRLQKNSGISFALLSLIGISKTRVGERNGTNRTFEGLKIILYHTS